MRRPYVQIVQYLLIVNVLINADSDRSSVRRFSRPTVSSDHGIADLLPATYTDLGPNVRASGSYQRPSRRIGLAFQDDDESSTSQNSNFRVVRKDDEDTINSRMISSQPDISAVVPSSTSNSKDQLSDRIAQLRKKFPRFRSRFGTRLKKSRKDSESESDAEAKETEGEEKTNEAGLKQSDELPSEDDPGFVIKRPTQRRPHYRTASTGPSPSPVSAAPTTRLATRRGNRRPTSRRPSMRNRFSQILTKDRVSERMIERLASKNTRTPPGSRVRFPDTNEAEEEVYTVKPTPPKWTSEPKLSSIYRPEEDEKSDYASTFSPLPTFESTKLPTPSESSYESHDDSTIHYPPISQGTDEYSRHDLNPHNENRDEMVAPEEDRTTNNNDYNHPSYDNKIRNDRVPERNRYQAEEYEYSRTPTGISNSFGGNRVFGDNTFNDHEETNSHDSSDSHRIDRYEDDIPDFKNTDNSPKLRWRPSKWQSKQDSEYDPSEYYKNSGPTSVRKEENDNVSEEEDPLLYRDDLRRYTADPSNNYQKPRAHHELNHRQEPSSEQSENDYSPIGYQHVRQNSQSDLERSHKWAFDPQWSLPPEDFKSMGPPTTERIIIARPTKVPGSLAVVRRNEFPFKFWQPDQPGNHIKASYPEKEPKQNAPPLNFKEVPEHLFTVGSGPVSVPEELVRKSYEMVTAAPTFDLMSNPFGSNEKSNFNSQPHSHNIRPIRPPQNVIPAPAYRVHNMNLERTRPLPSQGPRTPVPYIGFISTAMPQIERQSGAQFSQHRPGNSIITQEQFMNMHGIRPPPPPPKVLPGGNPYRASTLHPAQPNDVSTALGYVQRSEMGAFNRNKIEISLDNDVNRKEVQPSGPQNFIEIPVRTQAPNTGHTHNQLRPTGSKRPKDQRPTRKNRRRPNGNKTRRPIRQQRPKRLRRPQNKPSRGTKIPLTRPNFNNGPRGQKNPFLNSILSHINPHEKYSTIPPESQTKSHFEIKQDFHIPQGSHNVPTVQLGGNKGQHSSPNNILYIGSDPHEEQVLQPFIPPNHYIPQKNFNGIRSSRPTRKHSSPSRQPTTRRRPQRTQRPNTDLQESSNSIWSALTNFDFSFFNPFQRAFGTSDSEVDRVATSGVAALPSLMSVPGGLAVLGAGLSLFYFNFVWHPTPVVKARLIDVMQRWSQSTALSDEQQRAIGDITKVYSALSDIGATMGAQEGMNLPSQARFVNGMSHETLMSRSCKNKLVCQTYHEFDHLLEVTKSAATVLGGTLEQLDQDMLLEYFLAADRGHQLLNRSDLTCDDFYTECAIPAISVKNTLRDLVGIEYDRADNSLDNWTYDGMNLRSRSKRHHSSDSEGSGEEQVVEESSDLPTESESDR